MPEEEQITVLIVDDNEDDRVLVRRALLKEFAGMRILEARSRDEILRVLGSEQFDLVLTDYHLGWATGLNVLDMIKAKFPFVPVIMYTGTGSEEVAVAAMKAGLDDYILKSVKHIVRLPVAVRTALMKSQTQALASQLDIRLHALLDRLNVGVFRADADGKFVEGNAAFLRIIGMGSLEDAMAIDLFGLYANKIDSERSRKLLEQKDTIHEHELEVSRSDGTRVWVSLTIVRSDDGTIEGLMEDIAERKAAEGALLETEKKYKLLFERNLAGVFRSTTDGRLLDCNESFAHMLGYDSREEILKHPVFDFYFSAQDREPYIKRLVEQGGVTNFELKLRRRDGSAAWTLENVTMVKDANGLPMVLEGTAIDITERKAAEEKMLRDSIKDSLTGLPNKALFMDRLNRAIRRTKRWKDYFYAVLLLDVDRFKNINESLGHAAGDQLLVAFAQRLESVLAPTDTVARLGGDEFAILIDEIKSSEDAVRVADKILSSLRKPFLVSGHEVFVTASIGVLSSEAGYDNGEHILRDADTAMYRAKAAGKARSVVFDKSMYSEAYAQLTLENDLRRAIDNQELLVYYQPIVALSTGKVKGFEALIRWQHPKRGMIMPMEFIPLANETGLIIPIGLWVLKEACGQARAWNSQFQFQPPLSISVNLVARQFSQPELIDQIQSTLRQTGAEPSCIKLEITENTLMDNAEHVSAIIDDLRSNNIQLYIDDFGTGYSSLSYLQKYPIDTLKIDRSFIVRLDKSNEDTEIVRTIVNLAHNLGIDVIAEGVETSEQAAHLAEMGCEYGQGYYFSRPVSAESATAFLEKHKTTS